MIIQIQLTIWDDCGIDHNYEVPAKFDVCPRCKGRGTHTNPSIDGNGLTQSGIEEAGGQEFLDDYRNGVYDIQCTECHGMRVIKIVDKIRLTKEEKEVYEKWCDQQQEIAAADAQDRMIRMQDGYYGQY